MRQRRWWSPGQGDPNHALKEDENRSVNFLWAQIKIRDFYDAMAKMQACMVTKNNEVTIEVSPNETGSIQNMVHNHLAGNAHLCSKRGLCESWTEFFKSRHLDPFDSFPLSFVVRTEKDDAFQDFEKVYAECAKANKFFWIVKPADFSNRGAGIHIYDSLEEVRKRIQTKEKSWLIQKYIERPLLVNRRKIDIRAYCLVDLDMKAYYYEDAYLRTTSEEWSLENIGNLFAHLNNDAVQKFGVNYGKFESANKLSLDEFQKYLTLSGYNVSVEDDIVPQMKDRMRDCMAATHRKLNPDNLKCFEILGFDFMIDDSFSVWLIEVNSNPCLEQCNAFLARTLPAMLDEAFSLTIDKVFPSLNARRKTTKWQLIFDPEDVRVSSPARPLSETPGMEAIIEGPLDPFRGEKTLIKTEPLKRVMSKAEIRKARLLSTSASQPGIRKDNGKPKTIARCSSSYGTNKLLVKKEK